MSTDRPSFEIDFKPKKFLQKKNIEKIAKTSSSNNSRYCVDIIGVLLLFDYYLTLLRSIALHEAFYTNQCIQ